MISLRNPFFVVLAVFLCVRGAAASPPSDPAARKIYDHDYQWLSTFPANFVSTNIRGENDQQYHERRQAALDLLHERHDITVVPELMDELQRKTFLSGDICDILGDWKTKKSLPLLKQVAHDPQRPKDVRDRANKAIELINTPDKEESHPPSY
jgi:hypothetical protein